MKLSVLNTPARYCTIVLSALSYICAGAQVPPSANPSPQAPAQPAASQSNPATGPSQQPNSPKQQKSSAIILNFQLRPLKGNTEDLFDPASTNNPGQTRADKFWVNGQVVDATQAESLSALSAGFAAYRLSAPAGCQAATTISAAEIGVSKPPTNSLPIDVGDRNNIDLPEIKQVDMQFIRQKMTQAAQALSSISPWIGSAITSQYGGVQGSTNTTSYFAAQATSAGQPQVQSTYNTGQPSTVQTSYNGQCPSGYFISGITAGNGITCSAVTATTPSTGPLSGSLSSTQVTTPTPSLQTQITAPAFAATVPAQPAATGALNPTSTVAPNPYDALSQQVELNSELLTYEALYSGLASDNSFISPAGAVGGPRHQVTLAFPIDVSPFTPYKGAVAEVRVFMIPARVKTAQPPAHPLSVVNLLPASNTYNVARATTDTKQFGAGVTLDLIGISATGGKTKSTLYLAKDTDTIALQYQNPVSGLDPDVKTPMGGAFRNLLPVGECSATGQDVWKKTADDPNYDPGNAIVFGWQFKPVLGNLDIQPIHRLFFAQVALDKNQNSPIIFVETRWREYNRKTGVVGQIYKNSCTWKSFGTTASLNYSSPVLYLTTDDLGAGGNVRVTANGYFTDPNMQVRMGNASRAPDYIANDLGSFEFFTPASALVSSPDFEIVSEGAPPVPLVSMAAQGKSCVLDEGKVEAYATPYPDGTTKVSVHLQYGNDRDEDSQRPLVLFGTDVYGLHDHPFLPIPATEKPEPHKPHLRFVVKTDALTSNPAVTVKDINWSEQAITRRIQVGPTFTAIQPLDGSAPGAGDATKPTQTQAGVYRVTGTGFRGICPPDPKNANVYACLAASDPATGNTTQLNGTAFTIYNDVSARLVLSAAVQGPINILWTDWDGEKSEWSLSTKPGPPSAATPITVDKPFLKKGDSLSVVFSGRDFSGVSSVAFEGTTLNVLAQDKKSITVLVTTKVTTSAGSKDLIATGADGKPVILPLTVTSK